MKNILFVLIVIFAARITAQNSELNWSAFSSGFGLSNSTNFITISSAGQSFVGVSTNGNSRITSGFLSMSIDDIIPVELSGFTSLVDNNKVTLKWQTATEINNSGFEVERTSFDKGGKQGGWEKIGFVEGKGTTSEIQNYSYSDKNVEVGIYSYRIKQIDLDGSYKYFNLTENIEIFAPEEFYLSQNYPNPFNPTTKINFSLAEDSKVALKIFTMLGEEVTTLLNGDIEAGYHTINFNATSLNSGVYFYSLKARGVDGTNYISTKKMIVIK